MNEMRFQEEGEEIAKEKMSICTVFISCNVQFLLPYKLAPCDLERVIALQHSSFKGPSNDMKLLHLCG